MRGTGAAAVLASRAREADAAAPDPAPHESTAIHRDTLR